ncbi:hypothetical protein ISTM_356 [Insectomime virus]|uniref:Uncharacterized protein n=1 Tax=Tunisvirus fontaine2 TaxID=1421067 RepID=V9SFQ5_9VIRU|nr:hypothetical protein D1R32_gp444 [Tunisvirus fontaine2]AHA46254.1 hypothetical protein ISTM_356 [Insectomime virus]AHC55161.1 hypothetical protein TNS_ORF443 [Tunisvirus fontaine2]
MSLSKGFFKDIPIVGSYSTLPPVLSRGSLIFLTSDETLYVSDGRTWNATGGDVGPLAAQVAQNTANITTLQGEVATNTLDIGALQNDVATNTSDIGTLQLNVSANSTEISALQSDVSTLEGQVATNTTDIGTLQGQVATNTTNIQQNTDSVVALVVAQSEGFAITDNTQRRTYTEPIPRVIVSSVSPTVIYSLNIPLAINLNAVYLIQWYVLAHYEIANVYYAAGQSTVLSNGVGSLVSVFGTATNQTNNSGSANIAVTADFSISNYRLIVTSDSAVDTTYSGYAIVTNILNIVQ